MIPNKLAIDDTKNRCAYDGLHGLLGQLVKASKIVADKYIS